MAEQRKQLSEFQWASLVDAEKDVVELSALLEKAKQKQQMVIGLVLDSHGVLGQQISIDPQTRELIITLPDTPAA